MYRLAKYLLSTLLFIIILNIPTNSFSEESEINEVLNVIKKDLKTLERAVYSGNRLSVISYGKERPVNSGSNPLAWSQNRRSVTVKAN